jgi:N-acetylmuramoyl-L-alanine amidase/putative methionine-R-sulfoxide reductase with GAF domain
MATKPSNANPVLTMKAMDTSDTALQSTGVSVAQSTDRREALQALLAFSTLHDQIRRRRAEEARRYAKGLGTSDNSWEYEQFVLDEVLQLVAERAQTVTGADGIAIALAEDDEIICRASVGTMAPDRGVRLDSRAGFSGACFRTGRIIRCDDSEKDPRVNVEACRRLGTRSMVAVPLLGQQSVVGLLEAFSTEPFGFNDSDVRSLNLLAELILAALKPEDEDRIVRAAKVAAAELQSAELESLRKIPMTPPAPPAAESAPDYTPLEFSKEDIAPDLYEERAAGNRLGLWMAMLGILGILLAGGLWWKFRATSHAATAGAAIQNTIPSPQPVPSSVEVMENPALSVPIPSVPTPAELTRGSNSSRLLVTGVQHSTVNGVSTVVIDLQGPVQYRKNRLPNPERIYFDLLGTSLAPGLNGQVIDVKDGLISRIRVAQPTDNVTRVVLETTSGSTFWDALQQNPNRLVIQVRGTEAVKPEAKAQVQPSPSQAQPETRPAPVAPIASQESQARPHAPKLRIVIDAGHGGWDLGTVGKEGLLEKSLVLDVAQTLGYLLESRLGSEVIFTRKDDNYIPLEQRAEIANRAQADLFISVHANYSSLATARGVETYYSSFFSPPEAREIEYRENATATAVSQAKLSGRALKEKVDESRKLAASVQRALYGALASQTTGIRNRGVREASFVVLTGTEMPSILAEISFVSSPTDEARLQSATYRQQIAEALFKGIEKFAATSHHVKMAGNVGPSTGQ